MRDEIHLPDLQRIEHTRNVDPLRFLVVARLGARGEAHAAQIGDDHGMARGQLRGERRPHVAGIGKAVQHDDGRTRTANADVDLGAARIYLLGVKPGGKRLHIGYRGG